MSEFNNKIAIITGASRGIGRAIAILLAERGASVVVNYLDEKAKADAVVKEITDKGWLACAVQGDISLRADCEQLVEKTLAHFGKIDILVNNAGIHRESPIDIIDEKVWETIISCNVKGMYMLSVLAGKQMKKQGKGVIINIGSVAGMFPRDVNAAYATSKGAVWSLTRALAISLAPEVWVNAVAPGRIETDMSPLRDPEKREKVTQSNLRRRVGQPEDIARVVAFLASDEADWITGQTLVADGGASLL
jgi:3-oxoacyl-[acyl-carrier protein] reductase